MVFLEPDQHTPLELFYKKNQLISRSSISFLLVWWGFSQPFLCHVFKVMFIPDNKEFRCVHYPVYKMIVSPSAIQPFRRC